MRFVDEKVRDDEVEGIGAGKDEAVLVLDVGRDGRREEPNAEVPDPVAVSEREMERGLLKRERGKRKAEKSAAATAAGYGTHLKVASDACFARVRRAKDSPTKSQMPGAHVDA